MQVVSQAWKDNQNERVVSESFVELSFAAGDPEALADIASVTTNGAESYSTPLQIVGQGFKNPLAYATLEQNIWLLDGSRRHIPTSNPSDVGFVGNTLSLADCTFATAPIVTITFNTVHTPAIGGVTITWGKAYDEYARDFKVTAYNGAAVVAETSITNNTTIDSIVWLDITNYNKITVTVTKWCLPNRRAKILEVFAGIKRVYTKNELMSFEYKQDVDPLSSRLPKSSIRFSIDNTSGEYNPENPTGFTPYLMERQMITVKHGYTLDHAIEWIDGGVFYLSSWSAPQNGRVANFEAKDIIGFLNEPFIYGIYTELNGYSSTMLDYEIDYVLGHANLPSPPDGSPKWIIDDSITGTNVRFLYAPPPRVSSGEYLQTLANIGRCSLWVDRKGTIHIAPYSTSATDYVITEFNSYKKPETTLIKPLKRVDVSLYSYSAGDTVVLYQGSVYVSGTSSFHIPFNQSSPCNFVNTAVINGTLLVGYYYVDYCVLTITGTGDVGITVTGKSIKKGEAIITIIGNDTKGETQPIKNPLITNVYQGTPVGNWVKDYLTNRKTVKCEWRADPRLDALDIVTVSNQYTTSKVIITSVTLTYNGAWKGMCEGRVLDGMV